MPPTLVYVHALESSSLLYRYKNLECCKTKDEKVTHVMRVMSADGWLSLPSLGDWQKVGNALKDKHLLLKTRDLDALGHKNMKCHLHNFHQSEDT